MKRFLIITAFIALLAGCGVTMGTLILDNRTNLSKLSYGMSKDQVHEIMGQKTVRSASNPYRTAMFMTSEGVLIEVFYYWTDKPNFGRVTDQELTPVVFNNGKVVGWGREFWYDYSKKIELTVKQR